MSLTIESVSNLVWGNEEKTHITAMVKFKEFEQPLPYGINAWDKEAHGIELYNRVKNLKTYGEPAAYVAPPAPVPLTPAQKLEKSGLTVDELKGLLGL